MKINKEEALMSARKAFYRPARQERLMRKKHFALRFNQPTTLAELSI
ncbi:MAG: hypothetical protein E6X23_13330 [Mixta calida]|nr:MULTISPECIES: hypothetical protein [Mixta]MBS6057338.1 hypothetical protein [Pantoea sp.]KAF0859377.1 hypothetical protein Y888_11790 [Mixta calida B021323]MCR1567650.1 hypothetical protein [Mixta sp.]MDU3078748.1 hypothetical protein [Mixta calida]MDU3817388.1 hypothetical protein [Pantoea sp.]